MTGSGRVQVALRLPSELAARIDAVRGDVSRHGWIVAALEAATGAPAGLPVSKAAPKPLRLVVARVVQTSAEAKAGIKPINWRDLDDAK